MVQKYRTGQAADNGFRPENDYLPLVTEPVHLLSTFSRGRAEPALPQGWRSEIGAQKGNIGTTGGAGCS